MKKVNILIRPESAFATPPAAETLFGQICWAVAHLSGSDWLSLLLEGYCGGRPFAVVSDVMPAGYLPMPAVPSFLFAEREAEEDLQNKVWLPEALLGRPQEWAAGAKTDADVFGAEAAKTSVLLHNTLGRFTGTTGTGRFAPFQDRVRFLNPDVPLSVHALVDETLFGADDLVKAVEYVGAVGFGRNAAAGLGKFSVIGHEEADDDETVSSAWLALASFVPSAVEGLDAGRTFYRPKTHFGRHGDRLAVSAQPFKHPVLSAAAGGVIALEKPRHLAFAGKGIGGVSSIQPDAVHQGYAPVVGINLKEDAS